MDWKLCIICQTKTREPLQCPAMSKRKDVGASYASFTSNLEEFHKIGSVPGHLDVEELNQGQGIKHSFKERRPYGTRHVEIVLVIQIWSVLKKGNMIELSLNSENVSSYKPIDIEELAF